MADHTTDPHDAKVRTVPLPADDAGGGERVIAQENHSPEVAVGSGEWPSTGAPPSGPAPGTVAGSGGADHRPGDRPDGPPPGSAATPGLQHDGRAAGDGGPARLGDAGPAGEEEPARFPPVRDVLDADPVAGGSRSVPDDDAEGTGGTRFS